MDDFNKLIKEKIEEYPEEIRKLFLEAFSQPEEMPVEIVAEKITRLSKLMVKEEQ